MPELKEWIRLYSSEDRSIRLRAATGLLGRSSEVPLDLLIDILLNLHDQGLGAKAEKALLKRHDPEIVPRMIALLNSPSSFVREVACNVLGRTGDKTTSKQLLRMVDDPQMMVRRAAALALECVNDRSVLSELTAMYERHKVDDPNVILALEMALQAIRNPESVG